MRSEYTMRGMRGAFLKLVVEEPPAWPGERWFGQDLNYLGREALTDERDRLKLRLLLTPLIERDRWPGIWFVERLRRVELLLRADGRAIDWQRVRR